MSAAAATTTTHDDDDKDSNYNPTSPSREAPSGPVGRNKPSSPPYNPSSPSAHEEYDPESPAITKEPSGDVSWFDCKGDDPFAPVNLGDLARPVIMKRVRCHNQSANCSEMMELQSFVPAFLLRRKHEAPIPTNIKELPWFWGQAYCFHCRLSYMVRVNVP